MKNTALINIVTLLFICSFHNRVIAQQKPLIVFEQTPCFGSCPVFKMEIFKNSKMKLHAGKYMAVGEGDFTALLDKKECERLVNRFYELGFFQLKDEYTSPVTDLPSKYITFNDGKQSKTVLDYVNPPAQLIELENELQQILTKTKWRKSN